MPMAYHRMLWIMKVGKSCVPTFPIFFTGLVTSTHKPTLHLSKASSLEWLYVAMLNVMQHKYKIWFCYIYNYMLSLSSPLYLYSACIGLFIKPAKWVETSKKNNNKYLRCIRLFVGAWSSQPHEGIFLYYV